MASSRASTIITMGMIFIRSLTEMEPTSAATGALPLTPLAVAPIDMATRVTAARTAGTAPAAAVLSEGPARNDVWNWMVLPSALMNWAEPW